MSKVRSEIRGGTGRTSESGGAGGYRTRILLADSDPAAVASVQHILRSQDWEIVLARTGAEALEKARLEGPDAILAEFDLPDMEGPDLCRMLRQRSETATTPIIVLSVSAGVAERVASLRAGATDFLAKPPDAQELVLRLRAVLDLRREKAGFVVAVFGSKGGVGASTLAVNLAVALRREARSGVVLVDASPQAGVADILLNLQATRGIGQALSRLDDLEDRDFEALLIPHASGLQAMLFQERGLDVVRPEEMRKILVALRRLRDWIVVDAPPLLDENRDTVLELADRVLLVLTPEITSLRAAKVFHEHAMRVGLSPERVMVVLNRFPQAGGLERRAIENALGLAVQVTVPDDVKLVTYSTNRGVPIVQSHVRSGVARQVGVLAKGVLRIAQP